MSRYAINHSIHFDSEAFELYLAEAPTERIRIGAIASRCLTLLVQADGKIVTKREFMSGAWGSFGLEVTENSLAQVIHQLRAALEKLQPGHELILTTPRIGYRIHESVELLDAISPEAVRDPVGLSVAEKTPIPPYRSRSRLLLGLAAVACWVALYKLPGLWLPSTLPNRPFVEVKKEQIAGVTLHLEDMPAVALRPANAQLVASAKKLAIALNLAEPNLYRFASQDRALNLLCSGELRPGSSHCLGLQVDE
ncbi:winged helix-turn-helix domain-containing protein [Pseudomonas sp. C9-3]|uniref:winged helix-turn-helix domain-containing protein n=1 Tax=Pseudomonas sp. C9-3 TaxID=3078264 RepID=UPI0028E3E224|nr:winged helix-turn-helix domain-containing protein [Pseudomonas sp. C9-3]